MRAARQGFEKAKRTVLCTKRAHAAPHGHARGERERMHTPSAHAKGANATVPQANPFVVPAPHGNQRSAAHAITHSLALGQTTAGRRCAACTHTHAPQHAPPNMFLLQHLDPSLALLLAASLASLLAAAAATGSLFLLLLLAAAGELLRGRLVPTRSC